MEHQNQSSAQKHCFTFPLEKLAVFWCAFELLVVHQYPEGSKFSIKILVVEKLQEQQLSTTAHMAFVLILPLRYLPHSICIKPFLCLTFESSLLEPSPLSLYQSLLLQRYRLPSLKGVNNRARIRSPYK